MSRIALESDEFRHANSPSRFHAASRGMTEPPPLSPDIRSLFEHLPVALMLVDSTGRIILANSLTAGIFHTQRTALEGRLLQTLLPDAFSNMAFTFAASPMADVETCREVIGCRGDGVEIPIAIRLKPVPFGDGHCVLATVTDLSGSKRAEAESLQQRAELAHLSRVTMIGELSAALAHELNQPLMAILSNAEAAQRILLKPPPDTAELQEIMSDIVDDDRRAGEIIRRMRMLLKKGLGDHVPLDVNAIIVDVLRLVRSDLIQRNVEARLHLSPGLAEINGDPVQLQQVLVNLLFNARDAMEAVAGRRFVDIRTTHEPDGAILIAVEDSGCGVPPDMLERIFQPFETTKSEGMGLGLSVCRTIVSAHGGRIWAENLCPGTRVCAEFRPSARAT